MNLKTKELYNLLGNFPIGYLIPYSVFKNFGFDLSNGDRNMLYRAERKLHKDDIGESFFLLFFILVLKRTVSACDIQLNLILMDERV